MDELDDAPAAPPTPVDHGLVGLGMLLTLGGDLGLALHGFFLAALLLAPGTKPLVLVLWASVGLLRAAAQRGAGSMLLFKGRGAARTYFVTLAILAGGQAYAMIQVIETATRHSLAGKPFLYVLVAELAWPGVLLAVALALHARGRLRQAARAGEGVGLEGVPMLMTCLASVGVLVGLAATVLGLKAAASAPGLLTVAMAGAAVLLLVRAIAHLKAGMIGVRGGSPAEVEAGARDYARLGVLAAVIAPVVVAALVIVETPGVEAKLIVAAGALAAMFALASWPRLVPRVLEDRHAAAWADAKDSAPFVRADDGGLAALGWLLAALAALAAGSLAATAAGQAEVLRGPLALLAVGAGMGAAASPWLGLAAVAAQGWAAAELITGSARARLAAPVAALVAAGTTVWVQRELLQHVLAMRASTQTVAALAAIAAQVAIPVTAALLALRRR